MTINLTMLSKRTFCLALLVLMIAFGAAVPAIGGEDTSNEGHQQRSQDRYRPHGGGEDTSNERQQQLRSIAAGIGGGENEGQQQIRLLQQIEQKLRAANKVIKGSDPSANLPPIQKGQAAVFHLKYTDAEDIAEVLHKFYGSHQVRLAPDSEQNRLIVFASHESLQAISKLIPQLDVTNESPEASDEEEEEAEAPQALMVRIFWLADGLPEGEGSEANLPKGVLDAVGRLGLRSPRLVVQSTASLAIDEERGSKFQSAFPIILHGSRVQFRSHGMVRMLDDHPRLELQAEVYGQFELSGKLSAPLGHYMVLGTANYVTGGPEPFSEDPGFGAPTRKTTTRKKPATSRFALVVQVIEAESFAPEE